MKQPSDSASQILPIRDVKPHEKRVIWKVDVVNMKDLKKGDKFVMQEDGVFLHEGLLFVALEDGTEKDDGTGAVQAELL